MFERVLFPTDGSETATSVFEFAEAIATAHGAELHVLNVADTSRDSVTRVGGEVVDALETEGERMVTDLSERAAAGTTVETTVLQGKPKRTIVDYSERVGADLVVMPTHGRSGLERVLLGSVTEYVINNASVPVLAVNPQADGSPSYPPTDVLVPTDGSDGADHAVDAGIDLAGATGASLHVLTVVETASLGFDARSKVKDAELEATANETIAEATERAAASVDDVITSIRHGRPYREIRSYVEDNGIDLVTMGTSGQTDFSRYVLGGVASKLVRSSPVPVLTVRGESDESE